MTNTLLLKQKFDESGYKLSFIAECLGITRACLSNKVNNVREFKASEISKLCELLNIEMSEKEQIFFNIDVSK